MSTIEEQEVQYGTISIRFKVHYSLRKTIAIEVHPDQSVKVIAPVSAEMDRIKEKVAYKANWIQKQIRKFSKISRTEKTLEFVSGENIYYLGRQYRLKVQKGEPLVKLAGKYLWLFIPDKTDQLLASQLIEQWYKNHAIKKLNERFLKLSYIVEREKIKVNNLLIRKLSKRWGSCTQLGNITLNINLIKVPVDCIDYVIIHELCHLKHLNHSNKFYKLLEKYAPEWRKKQEKLNCF